MNRKLLTYSLLALSITVASLPAALSLRVKTDISSLLPKGGAFIAAQSAVEFPAFKSIAVMIESPAPLLPSERLGSAIDGLTAALRGIEGVATARAGLSDEEKISLFQTLFASRFHLFGYDEESALRTIRLLPMKLTLPGGDALRGNLGSDPLGLTERLAAILQGGFRGSMDLIDGRFSDDAGKRAFIIVRARDGYRGIEELETLIANIERLFAEKFAQKFPAGTKLTVTGGAVLACDSAGIMIAMHAISAFVAIAFPVFLWGFVRSQPVSEVVDSHVPMLPAWNALLYVPFLLVRPIVVDELVVTRYGETVVGDAATALLTAGFVGLAAATTAAAVLALRERMSTVAFAGIATALGVLLTSALVIVMYSEAVEPIHTGPFLQITVTTAVIAWLHRTAHPSIPRAVVYATTQANIRGRTIP